MTRRCQKAAPGISDASIFGFQCLHQLPSAHLEASGGQQPLEQDTIYNAPSKFLHCDLEVSEENLVIKYRYVAVAFENDPCE